MKKILTNQSLIYPTEIIASHLEIISLNRVDPTQLLKRHITHGSDKYKMSTRGGGAGRVGPEAVEEGGGGAQGWQQDKRREVGGGES